MKGRGGRWKSEGEGSLKIKQRGCKGRECSQDSPWAAGSIPHQGTGHGDARGPARSWEGEGVTWGGDAKRS